MAYFKVSRGGRRKRWQNDGGVEQLHQVPRRQRTHHFSRQHHNRRRYTKGQRRPRQTVRHWRALRLEEQQSNRLSRRCTGCCRRVRLFPFSDFENQHGILTKASASGVAVSLELARIFAHYKPKTSIAFTAFAGEEQGLLGAENLAQTYKNNSINVAGMINLDMVGK